MKLKHYTSSLKSAKSIISSKELWMKKTGLTKDSEEIFHYFDIFNGLNTIGDSSRIFKMNTSRDPKKSLYENYIMQFFLTYFYQANKLQLGQVLADIIRDESYVACFTEAREDESNYHRDNYGPIAFVFKDNPLRVREEQDFVFIQKEVHYIEKSQFNELFDIVEEVFNIALKNYNVSLETEDPTSELLRLSKIISSNYNKKEQKIKRKELKRDYERLELKVNPLIESVISIMNGVFLDLNKENKLSSYINQRVNEVRENRLLNYIPKEIVEDMRRSRMFQHDKELEHGGNLISCFIKDVYFLEDNETRIIALPTKVNVDEEYLKVDMDMELIEKIIVSTNIEDRSLVIQELKEHLESEGLSGIKVI